MNTIDGPTKLVRQDAILGGLSIGQLGMIVVYSCCVTQVVLEKHEEEFKFIRPNDA